VAPDGSKVFVTGGSRGPYVAGVLPGYATLAYDAATGSRLWLARYTTPHGAALAFALAVSPEGSKVFVTGIDGGYATVAYDTATGTALGRALRRPPAPGEQYAKALAATVAYAG
jgi:hypothetical protein